MREYELYLVIDAAAEAEQVEAIVERVTQLIATSDGSTAGEVTKVEPRGKRRMAYAINKKQESQDIVVTFQSPPHTLAELERFLKLNEQVLRYLLIRTSED